MGRLATNQNATLEEKQYWNSTVRRNGQ